MPDISPQPLLDAVMGHFQTSAIKAAVELDLFTAIGEGAHDAGAIAKRTGAAERGIEILADYLTVLGFLEKTGNSYALAPSTAVFLDRRSTEFYGDWDRIAHDAVGSLRAEAGRNPHDAALTSLVGELATRSDEFRVRWGGHDVRYYRSGTQPFRHPLVGDLTLDYDALEIPADPGQTIVAYSAPAGSANGRRKPV